MSSLVVFRRIQVENANAIAGLTYGFPAITHFLGFVHALSRMLQTSHNLTLGSCGVICHQYQLHTYGSNSERTFALTRNPLTKEGKTAAFNEEGRMHLTISLLVSCEGKLPTDITALSDHLAEIAQCQRLAGGTIINLEQVTVHPLPQNDTETYKIIRHLLPGFVLCDRTRLLQEHYQSLLRLNPNAEMIDAWLDFSSLKMKAIQSEENNTVKWQYVAKPGDGGFLVPLMIGYRAISPLYPPGEVANTRDQQTSFCFAEAAYGLGEWRGLHRIHNLRQILWNYDYQDGKYLCSQWTDNDSESDELEYDIDD
ncbi:type I-F CRISPR-associated protein Csy2 [Biostraticola tofi]|uniref:CRISPR-associated Csy2 family protein n=1 Tax=Biostraticola tofi TaxID=466109 RepID=A0A4R3YG52_9GAMM|nr:type I-F CRISPR-associated protein Csy2 [Biostraticola tofi]TCV91565.1 CRISPR-associated Csy2 family protein [Biostraticola tofi]